MLPSDCAASAGRFRPFAAPLAVVALCLLGGCGSTLETGYVPRTLGSNSAERRGYYASPFTPEAAAAGSAAKDPTSDIRNTRATGEGHRNP